MTANTFKNLESLTQTLDEKPYNVFSQKNTQDFEKLVKTSLKELNDCFVNQQKKTGSKLQELYVNKFDEEQIWSQMKSNDNLVNSKADNFISSILANIDQISLLPGSKKTQQIRGRQEEEEEENFDEEDWGGEEDEDEDEDEEGEEMEDDEEGVEYEEDYDGEDLEEGGNGDEDIDANFAANEQEASDAEEELRKFEELDRYLEDEEIKIDDDEEDGEGGLDDEDDDEEGGIGFDDGDDEDFEGDLKKLRLVAESEDEEDDDAQAGPQVDDAEVEDDIFDRAREDLLADNDEDEEVLKGDKGMTSEIDALEKKLLEKKAWQTQGEVKAGQRPVNSLLEETLDYNITKKASKKITPEYSGNLEAIIKQRILDEAWDDPIEYTLGKHIKETFNSLEEINFEKSSKGLGQIYEEDYKKDVMGIKAATPDDENKKEIELLFKKLSYNLDVLANLSFTPKGIFETTKIVPNVASINLEEKTPLSFSSRQAKAPQELFNPNKVQLESKEELTTAENRKARRTVKRNIRTRNKEKKKKDLVKKLEFKGQTKHEHNLQQKGIANYKKEVQKKSQKSVEFTKSSKFFDNLQKSQDKKKQPADKEEVGQKRKNYML